MEVTMNVRPKDALQKIIDAHDLHTSPLREDGKTYGMPSSIRSLRINGMKGVHS
jgi:hypothetical protein